MFAIKVFFSKKNTIKTPNEIYVQTHLCTTTHTTHINFKIFQHEIAEHDISNISFASQHEEDLQTFAYITHDVTTGKHYCHVFRVSTLVCIVFKTLVYILYYR